MDDARHDFERNEAVLEAEADETKDRRNVTPLKAVRRLG